MLWNIFSTNGDINKAAGIVSYGGISAGTRAANSLKADLSTFNMVPVFNAVYIPFFNQFIHERRFVPSGIKRQICRCHVKGITKVDQGIEINKRR